MKGATARAFAGNQKRRIGTQDAPDRDPEARGDPIRLTPIRTAFNLADCNPADPIGEIDTGGFQSQ